MRERRRRRDREAARLREAARRLAAELDQARLYKAAAYAAMAADATREAIDDASEERD